MSQRTFRRTKRMRAEKRKDGTAGMTEERERQRREYRHALRLARLAKAS